MSWPVRTEGPTFYDKASRRHSQEVIVILTLFRATGNGRHVLAAQLRVVNNNRVEMESHDEVATAYLDDLRTSGIWSRKCGRTVLMDDDGFDFLEAIVDSLSNSSYWHAVVETPTPTDMPVYAVSHN